MRGGDPLLSTSDPTSSLVEEGDRIAQLVIEKIETPAVVEVNVCDVHVLQSFLTLLTLFSGSRGNPQGGKWLWLNGSLIHYRKHLPVSSLDPAAYGSNLC